MPLEGRELRTKARLLARLVQADDRADIAELRGELGGDAPTDEQLECARELLRRLAEAVDRSDAAVWARVRAALLALDPKADSPSSSAPRTAHPLAMDSTASVDVSHITAAVLPFEKTPPKPSPKAAPQVPRAAPTSRSSSPWQAKPAGSPEQDLEAYASLCAELDLFPQDQAAALRKRGIAGDAALRQLHADWRRRLSADAALDARFVQMLQQYKQLLL